MSILSERRTSPTDKDLGLLVNGERMKQPEFHRRYKAYDEDEKWEIAATAVNYLGSFVPALDARQRHDAAPSPRQQEDKAAGKNQ